MVSYEKNFRLAAVQMQSLGESMKTNIENFRKNPEHVFHKTALKYLSQKIQNLYGEMDDCLKGVDDLTQNLLNKSSMFEREIAGCNRAIENCRIQVNYNEEAIHDRQREIKESEELIENIEEALENGMNSNSNHRKNLEGFKTRSLLSGIGGAACAAGSIAFPPLLIPAILLTGAYAGSTIGFVAERKRGEINVNEIQNRLENKIEERLSLESEIYKSKCLINEHESYIHKLCIKNKQCKYEIRNCRLMINVLTLCKIILIQWLTFLQNLEQSMDRLEYRFESSESVKDTAAFEDYVIFINGYDANRSLEVARTMSSFSAINEIELKKLLMYHAIEFID